MCNKGDDELDQRVYRALEREWLCPYEIARKIHDDKIRVLGALWRLEDKGLVESQRKAPTGEDPHFTRFAVIREYRKAGGGEPL